MAGTEIIPGENASATGLESHQVVAALCDDDKVLIEVTLSRPSVATALWSEADRLNLTLTAPSLGAKRLQFFAEKESLPEWKKLLQSMGHEGFVESFDVADDVHPVSLVGTRFGADPRAIAQVLDQLAGEGIHPHIVLGGASSLVLGIERKFAEDAVRLLHQKWIGHHD